MTGWDEMRWVEMRVRQDEVRWDRMRWDDRWDGGKASIIHYQWATVLLVSMHTHTKQVHTTQHELKWDENWEQFEIDEKWRAKKRNEKKWEEMNWMQLKWAQVWVKWDWMRWRWEWMRNEEKWSLLSPATSTPHCHYNTHTKDENYTEMYARIRTYMCMCV